MKVCPNGDSNVQTPLPGNVRQLCFLGFGGSSDTGEACTCTAVTERQSFQVEPRRSAKNEHTTVNETVCVSTGS